jgi:hypothetical protein
MRYLLLLFLAYSLHAGGYWTLTGLSKANVYVKNDLSSLKVETLEAIKSKMSDSLKKNGILMHQQDSSTLVLSLEEIANDESSCVYVKLYLAEDVQTYREDKTSTFAMTYESSDFIEVELTELDKGILESVDFLLSQFSELYEEDKD